MGLPSALTRQNVIDNVKKCMDELTPFSEGLVLSDANAYQKPIEAYIENFVDKAGDSIQMILPDDMLDPSSETAIAERDNGIGKITLPKEYLRLSYLKWPEWDTAIFRAHGKRTRVGEMQQNKYLRGGLVKPIAILREETVFDSDFPTSKKLFCYSVLTEPTTEQENTPIELHIIKSVPAEKLSEQALQFTYWKTAVDVFTAMGEIEYAKGANEKLNQLISEYVQR